MTPEGQAPQGALTAERRAEMRRRSTFWIQEAADERDHVQVNDRELLALLDALDAAEAERDRLAARVKLLDELAAEADDLIQTGGLLDPEDFGPVADQSPPQAARHYVAACKALADFDAAQRAAAPRPPEATS